MMDTYRQIIQENIEYDVLVCNHEKGQIDEFVELMLDTVCFPKNQIHINGTEYPCEVVKSRLLKLRADHIDYVIESMKKTTSEIRNIKTYLLTALYNSFTTMENYHTAEYSADSVWLLAIKSRKSHMQFYFVKY
jgi:hypothetical protein